ncbi:MULTISPECIES: NUMOD4 domain-containing protein [Pseudomonas syringae group]|uniref:HNH endonuclease n=4 Tax=root TaxID=1 RepID=A0AAW4DSN2_PSESX|nr:MULTISPECIES: NUMOD4 domain-containing protein [Pseudomonas syringae group]YP_010773003.1 hypothetical protein QIT78_gp73 [Pseudomonas phage Medea1]AVI85643.1 hypothetical protein XJ28_19035 [Pseudomonas syringae pv. tomato]KGK96196.1 hypothetical protein NB04_06970 [Pseudomonas syringae pv. tomato]KUR47683.1 NUMOD4 motif protein [Pseudomonas syringae pv. tomato]KUR48088.1 NUMOD4 motif protein [Pseudomonas syringae pv. tomato]MBI6711675.1 HNH endonuclease [Pseudomonas syringae]
MMTIEVWRDIDDWPGYEVSDQGRVRRGARLKAPDPDRKGYLRVKLWKNGKSKNRLIHGLVAAAFIGPRPAGCICRHADGDNQNNCYVNLSYGTPTENEADKIAHGTAISGERHPAAKLTREQVMAIRKRYKPKCKINGKRALAKQFNICESQIYRVITGQHWPD